MAETLCLADVNIEAIEACRRTILENGLSGRVSVYHSDNLEQIPVSERWDLVVANPPHMPDDRIGDLRTHDDDRHLHLGFFADVGRFLKPGGVIVLQENNRGSTRMPAATNVLRPLLFSRCHAARRSTAAMDGNPRLKYQGTVSRRQQR